MRHHRHSIPVLFAISSLLSVACAGNRALEGPAPTGLPRSVEMGPTLTKVHLDAPLVDTILVRTGQLELRVGERLSLFKVLLPEGRAASGQVVAGFLPVFLLETTGGVVEITDWGLQAIGPGTASIVVLPMVVGRGHWVATRVPITVRSK